MALPRTLGFPDIYLLPTHLAPDDVAALEHQIPTLTDIKAADIILTEISSVKRAGLELRSRGLQVVPPSSRQGSRSPKRRRTASNLADNADGSDAGTAPGRSETYSQRVGSQRIGAEAQDTIQVIKLPWFTDSVTQGLVLPVDDYLICHAVVKDKPQASSSSREAVREIRQLKETQSRARRDAQHAAKPESSHGRRRQATLDASQANAQPPRLLRIDTTEEEAPLPPLPSYLHTTYSCERPTPSHSPNEEFLSQLRKIKRFRILRGDEVGVRAYSTGIAAIAAYPYKLKYATEILRLPGCDQKLAFLFQEWIEEGRIKAIEDLEADTELGVIGTFYDIWGVGAATAREFYHKGFRDLDDLVEYAWTSLPRVQQIGIKYYEEFQQKIPRLEVEHISNTILVHANNIHPGFQMCIVGGYRKGKAECGDVDVVLSHKDKEGTLGFIPLLVEALEHSQHITHTLILSLAHSERGQRPPRYKDKHQPGSGFDPLDKALVVWQEPQVAGQESTSPSPHRRVDIIIAPWSAGGCGVLAWSSGTTFQRDLRRYCKKVKGWKFDGSGIRSRLDGTWVDVESPDCGLWDENDERLATLEGKEQLVFEALGLEYREPWERLTD